MADENDAHATLLHARETALGDAELATLEREAALLKRERTFIGRRLALSDYDDWICDEEQRLLALAGSHGSAGTEAVTEYRRLVPTVVTVERTAYRALEVCKLARTALLEQRQSCIDGRNQLLAQRMEEIKQGETELGKYEGMLQQRAETIAMLIDNLLSVSAGVHEMTVNDEPRPNQTLDYPYSGFSQQLPPEPALPPSSQPPSPAETVAPMVTGRVDASQRREGRRVGMELIVSTISEHNFFTGFSKNISSGGIFVATHTLLPLRSEVTLKFHLPGGHAVTTIGVVQWVREYNEATGMAPGMGLQFRELREPERHAIERFIKIREPMFFDDDQV